MAADRETWQVFDVTYRREPEQESGQVLVDKRRCWRALCLCDWYNQNSDLFYRFVYGDKDTFRLAWRRAGQSHAMPARIGHMPYTICQGDFQGRLVFQHRAGDKWSFSGNHKIAGFTHQEECAALVEDLLGKWPVSRYFANARRHYRPHGLRHSGPGRFHVDRYRRHRRQRR